MVQSAMPHGYVTVEEYLELEKTSSAKHEYVAGETHAMVTAQPTGSPPQPLDV